jgi:hypothetical protein
MAAEQEVAQAQQESRQALLDKPNVVGVGVGYKTVGRKVTDQLCVVAMVRRKIPKAGLDPEALVPQAVDQVPTDVIEVGDLVALKAPTGRWRPAPGGVSIGHFKITAGTFGCIVRDRASGDRLILSNNHVLANSNAASVGDAVVQPGTLDGGFVPDDVIAHLERFHPIQFGTAPPTCDLGVSVVGAANAVLELIGSAHRLEVYHSNPTAVNRIDAALARPVDDQDVLDEILQIGVVQSWAAARLGMSVRKSGRTTGLTEGEVTVLNATVDISYGVGTVARFENQIVSTPMSQGGDSGSLLVAGDALQAVGLLFAGSDQATVYNPIAVVLDSLGITLAPHHAASLGSGRTMEHAAAVRERHEAELLSKANVVGVGTGLRRKGGEATEDVAVVVMVEKKVPRDELAPEDVLPAQIEGVPVDVQEVGQLRAQ